MCSLVKDQVFEQVIGDLFLLLLNIFFPVIDLHFIFDVFEHLPSGAFETLLGHLHFCTDVFIVIVLCSHRVVDLIVHMASIQHAPYYF